MNGDQHVRVVSTGTNPIEIVVDPISKVVIWSTLEDGILSASMDGSNKQALVVRGVEWPTGLAIDYAMQRLYWSDFRQARIETSLLSGEDRHIVYHFEIDGNLINDFVRYPNS